MPKVKLSWNLHTKDSFPSVDFSAATDLRNTTVDLTPQNMKQAIVQLMFSHVVSKDQRRHTNWSVPMLSTHLGKRFPSEEWWQKDQLEDLLQKTLDTLVHKGTLETKHTSKPGTQYSLSESAILKEKDHRRAVKVRPKSQALSDDSDDISMSIVRSVVTAVIQDPAVQRLLMAKIEAEQSKGRE